MKNETSIQELYEKILRMEGLSESVVFNTIEKAKLKKIFNRAKLGLRGAYLGFVEKDEKFRHNYCLLTEKPAVQQLNLQPQNNNLLIEGENYHALIALKQANVKVDIICAYPPYNTGRTNFVYNGKAVDINDPYKHSKWLSFMKKRLKLAKDLLHDHGVIFVLVDDQEQDYLKVLMDEIFGEDNFICNFIWEKAVVRKNNNRFVSDNHDYILCYRKSSILNKFQRLSRTEKNNMNYRFDDQDGRGLYQLSALTVENGKKYDIFLARDIGLVLNLEDKNGQKYDILETYKPGKYTGWRFNKEKMQKLIQENRIHIPKKGKRLMLKKHLKEVGGVISNTILVHELVGHTKRNQMLLNRIFSDHQEKVFDYPKGPKLIKYLIKLIPNNENATILNFFVSSGTVGQAVMELNHEDQGQRRFILIKEKYDLASQKPICREVVYERLYRVINGVGTKGQAIDWSYSSDTKALLGHSLHYLQVKYIDKLNGEFEDIGQAEKTLYQAEFNHKLTIKDFAEHDND